MENVDRAALRAIEDRLRVEDPGLVRAFHDWDRHRPSGRFDHLLLFFLGLLTFAVGLALPSPTLVAVSFVAVTFGGVWATARRRPRY
jgi:hypothetical protein